MLAFLWRSEYGMAVKHRRDTKDGVGTGREVACGHAGLVSLSGRVVGSRDLPVYSE